MNKKILIFIFLTPCYTLSILDDWKPSNTGLNATKELTSGALKVVAAVAAVIDAPNAYSSITVDNHNKEDLIRHSTGSIG